MFRLDILLLRDNTTWSLDFETQADAQNWTQSNQLFFGLPIDQSSVDLQGKVTVIPASYTFTIADVTAQVALQADIAAKLVAGQNARNCCNTVLAYVAGHNIVNALTLAQINQMMVNCSVMLTALNAGMPQTAKAAIANIVIDGVTVTSDMVAAVNSIFAQYGY